jgi:hypothetical protein
MTSRTARALSKFAEATVHWARTFSAPMTKFPRDGLNPSDPMTWTGDCESALANLQEAKRHLEEALNLEPFTDTLELLTMIPGKDLIPVAEAVAKAWQSDCVIIVVFDGKNASQFMVRASPALEPAIPTLLRALADEVQQHIDASRQ